LSDRAALALARAALRVDLEDLEDLDLVFAALAIGRFPFEAPS
jgi:hypothetical protein